MNSFLDDKKDEAIQLAPNDDSVINRYYLLLLADFAVERKGSKLQVGNGKSHVERYHVREREGREGKSNGSYKGKDQWFRAFMQDFVFTLIE